MEDIITCGRQSGNLQLHKPGDLRITRPHAMGNPFTNRLACTNSGCRSKIVHGRLCDACREAVCDGYEQLASEQTDVAGRETTVRDMGIARGLAVHTAYAEQDASTLRSALQECATAVNAGQPIRLLCGCPTNMRCHRDAARARVLHMARAPLGDLQRSSRASRHEGRQRSGTRQRLTSAARGPRVRWRQALRHGPSATLAGVRRQRATRDGCGDGRTRAEWRQRPRQQQQQLQQQQQHRQLTPPSHDGRPQNSPTRHRHLFHRSLHQSHKRCACGCQSAHTQTWWRAKGSSS